MGLSRPKVTVVHPPNLAVEHPDMVITGLTYAHNCANPVPLLCSRGILNTGHRTHQERCTRFGMGVVSLCSVAKTSRSSTVTALDPGLPLLLKDLSVSWNAGTKRVGVEDR